MEILESKFKSNLNTDNNILTKDNLNQEINKFYKGTNFYLINNVRTINPKFLIQSDLVKEIKDSNKIINQKIKEIYAMTLQIQISPLGQLPKVKEENVYFRLNIKQRGLH